MEFVGTGPLAPAVTVGEFKRAAFIEQSITDDDALIAAYIAAAEDVVSTGANRPLAVGDYRFVLPLGDWACWWFPCAPVEAVLSVERCDHGGNWEAVDPERFSLFSGYDEPQLRASDGVSGFGGDVTAARVTARVGRGTSDQTTLSMRQAVILIAKEWLDAGDGAETASRPPSFAARALIKQKRYLRPCEVV